MRPTAAVTVLAFALVAAFGMPGARAESLRAVVFDIEPAGDPLPDKVKDRLEIESERLRKLLVERGVTIIDTTPQAAKIKQNLPLSQCNGCDQDIAKALGADIEIAVAVQPTSAAESALSGNVKDVQTNRVLRSGVVNIRGDNENEWAHGVKFLVKERFLNPPLPADAAALRKLVDAAPSPKE